MHPLPPGFSLVEPVNMHVQSETEIGVRIYKSYAIAMSKPMRDVMPKERFPRLVVAANDQTGEVYIGPALNGEAKTFANSDHINAKTIHSLMEKLEMEVGQFYRATRAGNGYVFSNRTKR